ncbi:MAG TPA: hypothetical protein VGA53_02235 [Candidatus Paceibacterota bacterium]
MKDAIPRRTSLFWDVDPKTIDPKKNARYVIERILEFGRDSEIRWLLHYYPVTIITGAIKRSRILSPKTANFWALFFNLPKDELRCFQKSSLKLQSSHWIR